MQTLLNSTLCFFRPCFLVLDSLNNKPCPNKEKNITFLREYLSCEYFAKFGQQKDISSLVWKSVYPKVPMQTNYFDCGLFLLQYVEKFCLVSDFSSFLNNIQIYHLFNVLYICRIMLAIAITT